MNKLNKIIITIFIVSIAAGVALIFVILKSGSSNNNSNTKIVQTPQGSIAVKDYTQNPAATTTDAIILDQKAEYQILNYKIDNSFLITLLSEPLKQARTDAENAFLQDLNITETQACELTVSVSVPKDVDSTYSGQELGLSFCPNAVSLP